MVTRFTFWFYLKDCLFGGVKLAKNANPDKYVYSGYGIGFDSRSESLLPDGSIVKNVIIFGVDMSWSVHIDNEGNDILVLGIGPTQGLDDTMLAVEAQYSFNLSRSNRKLCLNSHHNGSNSTKIYQFEAKVPEIKEYPLCLENISEHFSINNMKKKQD